MQSFLFFYRNYSIPIVRPHKDPILPAQNPETVSDAEDMRLF